MTEAQYPHCNSEVLHAPGECAYCDMHPDRQQMRIAGGTPFTPNASNGWSGNTAAPAGKEHTHMGASFVPGAPGDGTFRCDSVDLGYQCEARVREGELTHFGYHHFGARSWPPDPGMTPYGHVDDLMPPVTPRRRRLDKILDLFTR